jgi:iron complex transport system ATP-binding protein
VFTPFTRSDVEIARGALAVTGAEGFWDRPLGTLSGGERQKVYIAAALAQQPKILLLDEPTNFLDYRHRDEIHRLLDRIHRQGDMTIVTVTHDVNTAAVLDARVLALVDGRIAVDGPAAAVIDASVLESVFDTPFELAVHPASGRLVVVPCEVRQ